MSLFELLRERAAPQRHTGIPKSEETEPTLALMLAQQAVTRWQFDLERFAEASDADNDLVVRDSELSIQQIRALRERITPFRNYVEMAVRFEAEEVLVTLEGLEKSFARIVHRRQPDAPWRDATEVVQGLSSRRY
jgi:hypothetical protein